MIDKFLKAKHWQLFTLMFGIPILFQIALMSSIFLNIDSETNIDPFEMFDFMKYFSVIMAFYMGVFFAWYWSIAIGLQSKVPENVKMKTKKFKIFFFIPIFYLLFILFFMGGIFSGVMQVASESDVGPIFGMVGVILPLHLLSMFGIFYSLYFVAKTFKTVELQKEVSFGDFAGEFFLLWFYIIGIWIIQPKINKMVEDEVKIIS